MKPPIPLSFQYQMAKHNGGICIMQTDVKCTACKKAKQNNKCNNKGFSPPFVASFFLQANYRPGGICSVRVHLFPGDPGGLILMLNCFSFANDMARLQSGPAEYAWAAGGRAGGRLKGRTFLWRCGSITGAARSCNPLHYRRPRRRWTAERACVVLSESVCVRA